jgi:hypothetical protein
MAVILYIFLGGTINPWHLLMTLAKQNRLYLLSTSDVFGKLKARIREDILFEDIESSPVPVAHGD